MPDRELFSDFDLDDLPEDDRYPEIVFGPEAIEQIRRMAEQPPPPWLQNLLDQRATAPEGLGRPVEGQKGST